MSEKENTVSLNIKENESIEEADKALDKFDCKRIKEILDKEFLMPFNVTQYNQDGSTKSHTQFFPVKFNETEA